jgi:predicted acyltransferase
LALQFLALCYWLIDIKGYKLWTKPFVIFGVNAIVLFVGTGVMARLMGLIKVPKEDGTTQALQAWIYDHGYASWLAPNRASLAFAISFILLWLFLMWLLYRKNVIIKI